MTQDPQENVANQQNQLYDASFKGWILQQAPAILPILLPGTIYEETLDVEILRSPMRADKVFKVRYHDEEHVLHLEFEVGYDKELKSRLLVYNSVLYRDHHLPVLTVVVYPFHVKMAESPLCILIQKQPILTFVFQTFPLFKLNVKEMVQQRYTCMYPLLPTMKNVDIDLVEQAVQELLEIYRDEKTILADQLVWMRVFLDRTTTIKRVKKKQIKERLNMFEQLFEESPFIQKIRKQSLAKGRQDGIKALQDLLVSGVQARYPDLAELARRQADHCDKLDVLKMLTLQVMTAPDASAVRRLLESGTDL